MAWASGKPPDVAATSKPAPLEREEDYEAVTLMRLRQAQEKKRLVEKAASKLAEPLDGEEPKDNILKQAEERRLAEEPQKELQEEEAAETKDDT